MSERADKRHAKAWWHDEAKAMAQAGVSVAQIASKFRRSYAAAYMAVRDKRPSRKKLQKRVAIGFTPEQAAAISKIASASGASFSHTVSSMVQQALDELGALDGESL